MSDLGTLDIEVHEDPAELYVLQSLAAGKLVAAFSSRFFGWCLQNTSSSTLASLNIYDGADTNGRLIFPINLAANEVSVVSFGSHGLHFKNGIYVNVTAQTVQGSIFYRRIKQR